MSHFVTKFKTNKDPKKTSRAARPAGTRLFHLKWFRSIIYSSTGEVFKYFTGSQTAAGAGRREDSHAQALLLE